MRTMPAMCRLVDGHGNETASPISCQRRTLTQQRPSGNLGCRLARDLQGRNETTDRPILIIDVQGEIGLRHSNTPDLNGR